MNKQEIDTIMNAAKEFGAAMGEVMSITAQQIYNAVESFGKELAVLLDPNILFLDKSWERRIKKLIRRKRYLRRYRQRGERMKSGKTRFHKARHKRF